MSYIRVLPRDLFNEANLLKCHGQLVLCLERISTTATMPEDVASFDIQQCEDSGSLFVANLPLTVGSRQFRLTRPLNSREPWPLYAEEPDNRDFEPVSVFDDKGALSPEMRSLLLSDSE